MDMLETRLYATKSICFYISGCNKRLSENIISLGFIPIFSVINWGRVCIFWNPFCT